MGKARAKVKVAEGEAEYRYGERASRCLRLPALPHARPRASRSLARRVPAFSHHALLQLAPHSYAHASRSALLCSGRGRFQTNQEDGKKVDRKAVQEAEDPEKD
ncbi:MAG: hypothetical protein SGPRY_007810 [Prymnesium sp.]